MMVYSDVNWAGTLDDKRTTSGYFTFIEDNLVTLKS